MINQKIFHHTVEPLLLGQPFCSRKVAFQEGWPLVRGRNQYIYVKIYIVEWPFQRGWPLVRVASQKGFYCIGNLLFNNLPLTINAACENFIVISSVVCQISIICSFLPFICNVKNVHFDLGMLHGGRHNTQPQQWNNVIVNSLAHKSWVTIIQQYSPTCSFIYFQHVDTAIFVSVGWKWKMIDIFQMARVMMTYNYGTG